MTGRRKPKFLHHVDTSIHLN